MHARLGSHDAANVRPIQALLNELKLAGTSVRGQGTGSSAPAVDLRCVHAPANHPLVGALRVRGREMVASWS